MFYEMKHSSNKNFIRLSRGINQNFNFPLHFHESFEFIYVVEGVLHVGINGFDFDVKSGEGAFILPNQPHEFSTPEYSRSWLAIFSADHLPELKNAPDSKMIFHPVIKPDDCGLFERFAEAKSNPFKLRSLIYSLAALYSEGESAPELSVKDGELVCRVVEYIDEHYKENLTLLQMSKDLGYSYRYMSGIVNRFFKRPLPQVVNTYRVNYACELISKTSDEITDIALRCGFGSIRNFNRSFKEVMGISPHEYREKNGAAV